MFKFFAMGVASAIFETQGATATNGAGWLFTSALGKVVLFVFTIGLMMFFINFLLSYSQKTQIDSSGNPVSAQVKRLQYLKWPMIMVFLLILGPFILISADGVMSLVLERLIGGQPDGFSRTDLSTIPTTISQLDVVRSAINEFLSSNVTDLNDKLVNHQAALNYIENLSQTFSSTLTVQQLADLKAYLDNDELYSLLTTKGSAGSLASEIDKLVEATENALWYVQNTMQEDVVNLSKVLYELNPGEYITRDQQQLLQIQVGNLAELDNNMAIIQQQLGKMYNGTYSISKSYSIVTELQYNLQKFVTATNADWGSKLVTLGEKISPTTVETELRSVAQQIYNVTTSSTSQININVYAEKNAILHTIVYGGNGTSGFMVFANTTPSTMQNVNIVGTIYSAITGDPNISNWNAQRNDHFVDNAKPLQWVFGVFSVFGMILIIYTYTTAAIKRTFYLINYWVLGFIYLANGINNEQAVKQWMNMFIGKWWCIFVLYLLFNLVSLIYPIITPVIDAGLGNNSQFMYTDINFIVSMALLFTLESAYQVVYQIWNKYEGSYGAGEEQFQAQKSTIMTEGKQTFNSTVGYLKTAGKIAIAVPSGIKKVVVGSHETAEWWRKLSDQKMDDGKSTFDAKKSQIFQTVNPKTGQEETGEQAAQPGGAYDQQGVEHSKPGILKRMWRGLFGGGTNPDLSVKPSKEGETLTTQNPGTFTGSDAYDGGDDGGADGGDGD
ncbi:MAG: hypothetical protein LBV22_02015 [Mycoplasmataceae bacterium]|nr:hypothetical protein [Mycoplasmataceae bacterium]